LSGLVLAWTAAHERKKGGSASLADVIQVIKPCFFYLKSGQDQGYIPRNYCFP